MVENLFVNNKKNRAGIYGVKFYILGKPWVVTVDEEMLFANKMNPQFIYTGQSKGRAMWASILEKAWAKAHGNYLNMFGDNVHNGLHYLTGVPVFSYGLRNNTNRTEAKVAHERIAAGSYYDYVMTATTEPTENNTHLNACGLRQNHAYSIVEAFNMTDRNNLLYRMYLLRDPRG